MHVLTMAPAPLSPQVGPPTEEGVEADVEIFTGIHEHSHLLQCQRVTAERRSVLAPVFGASLEAMRAQLTTARTHALVGDDHREAELQGLLQDGRVELARLKKLNRELAADLQATYSDTYR